MDLLYSRYSSPMELVRLYIDQGRFGEFVKDIIQAENRRRREAAEQAEEDRLWMAYVHSYSDKSFNDWKDSVLSPASRERSGTGRKRDEDMTNADIYRLMKRLFPAT